MDNESEAVCSAFLMLTGMYAVIEEEHRLVKKVRRKRRWWVRPINCGRIDYGYFDNLFQKMKVADAEQFLKYTRMSRSLFTKLLDLVKPRLQKHSIRRPLCPEQRLCLTVYYLAHGCSMQVVAWSFYIGKSTASTVIRETYQVIWEVLHPIYLPQLNTPQWRKKAEEYWELWNLPNCCGALDGKHINIQAPKKSGSAFFNYKKNFSLVLLAVCDANYLFTMVNIGAFGSQSDGGIYKNSGFEEMLTDENNGLPAATILPNSNISYPHFIVADEVFPLKPFILHPYPGKSLSESNRIFNYRLSRARRTIENTFGILASRCRIFRNNIIAEVETVEKISAAGVCLHNFLRTEELEQLPSQRTPLGLENGHRLNENVSSENSWQSLGRLGTNNASKDSYKLRDTMRDYLVTQGAVPWQWTYILQGSYPQ